jgi:translocation and assembly module TamB
MGLPRHLGRLAGCVLVFALAAGGGAIAHRNVPAVRRAIVARVNAALVTAVPGRIRIEQIGSLGLDRVAGVSVAITDPDGATVLHVRDLSARIDVGALLRSLRSGGPLEIDLPGVSAASVDVNLDPGPTGALRIASAFVAEHPPPPSAATSAARGVHLQVREVELDRVTVRGSPVPSLPLDVDLDGVVIAAEIRPGSVLLDRVHAVVTARGMPPGSTMRGVLDAHFEQPSMRGGERGVQMTWSGTVGAIATTASATLEGNAVYAVVDAPTIQPADLIAVWPASPLTETASAHVEAVGLLPTVLLSVHATAGHGTLDAGGPVMIDGTRRAAIRFAASSLDVQSLAARAPRTSLDASGKALFAMNAAGAMGGVAAMDFAGTVGPTVVPFTEVAVDFMREAAPSDKMRAQARLVVREPGAPSTVDATVTPKGEGLEVAFDASVVVPDLDRVLRLGPIAQGSARLSARGRYDTALQHLDANVSARASHVSAGPVSLGSLTVDARATGPLTTPDLEGDIHGRDLDLAGVSVSHLHAGIHGPASGAEVSLRLGGADAQLQAKATVAVLGASATVRDLHVTAQHGAETARLDADRITVTAREQRVDEAEIRGFGAPLHVTALATPGTFTLRTRSHAIELARIARFAGLTTPMKGRVSLDVDATLHRTEGEGHVAFDVTDASLGPVADSEAHVDLTLAGRHLAGMVSARVGDVGTLSVQSKSLEIGGTAPLGAASWRALRGSVDAQGSLDLATLAGRLPAGALPISRIGGALELDAHVVRDSATDASPEISLSAATKGLVASGPSSAPWTLQGTDLQADLKVEGANAHTTLSTRAIDRRGTLASVTVASDGVPYSHLLAGDEPLLALLRAVPFTGSVSVPGRELADFPAVLGTRGVHGELGGTLDWEGSLDKPTIDAHVTLAHGGAAVNVLAGTLDLALTGHYDGERLTADLTATSRSQTLLDAAAQVDVRGADLLARLEAPGTPPPLPWKASTQVKLTRFPLQSLAALDDRQMRGHLSGDFSIQGLHDDAHATADLSSGDLSIGDMACKNAMAKVTFDGKTLDAQVGIDQADGTLQAFGHAGARWGAAMTPSLDQTQPADVTVTAKTFRVDLIQPLAESVFSELDGRLDAEVTIHADPARHLFQPQGSVHLTGGVVEVAGIGGEFHDATAEIDFTPDGVVKLQKVSAMGLSGKVEAAASARFDGLTFAGARANLQVQRQQPLPLVLDGVQVGTFDGQIAVAVDPIAAAKGGGYDVKVDVPQMQLQLPLQTARTVQTLGALNGVTIGAKRPGKEFVVLPLDGPTQTAEATSAAGSPLRVTIALGQNVVVKRSTQLQVYLAGSPTITVGNDVKATGQVKLLRGSLDVQGKTFTIETGTVTFIDDPTNPQVVLTASWPAPDGTTIYANFVGPLKTGKVTLSADPARPQNEILSLILFGTTDEQAPSAAGSTAQQAGAVGAAGGAATAPINQALGGVNQMLDSFGLVGGISTRVDTSQATPRPEVEIQIARDLSVQVAWVLGVPPPGSNPDTTLFTLDWRFLRSWSLETTVGDAGTSILDLIWQHRY